MSEYENEFLRESEVDKRCLEFKLCSASLLAFSIVDFKLVIKGFDEDRVVFERHDLGEVVAAARSGGLDPFELGSSNTIEYIAGEKVPSPSSDI